MVFSGNSIDFKCQFVEMMDLKMCNGEQLNECD
jgi:hypothetical protein